MGTRGLTTSLRETIDVFDAMGDACEPLTTKEVTDQLDVSRRSTYERLERLVEEGLLETKKAGARGRVWWRPPRTAARATTGGDQRPPVRPRVEFRALVDAVEEYAIFRLDEDGYVRTWNPGAEQIKGYEPEEIIGEHLSTFYTEGDVANGVPEANLDAAAATGEIADEGWRVRNDGSKFWANVTLTAIRDEDGTLEGFAKVTRDMTERREYEQRLREEKTFLDSLLDNQQDVVFAFDADGDAARWNDRLPEVTGYSDEEIANMHPAEFVASEANDRVVAALERVLGNGECVTIEVPLETADGRRVPYEVTASPMADPDGNPTGLTGIGRDVSERKERERRLERQQAEIQAELKDVIDRVADGFFALDGNLRFTYVNDRAEDLFDCAESAVIGCDVRDVLDLPGRFESALLEASETQEPGSVEAEFEFVGAWFQCRIYPSKSGVSVYFRDVTEQKDRERELKLYETIVSTMPDGVYVLDEDRRFCKVNEAYEELTGYDREELLGAKSSLVVDDAVEGDAAELVDAILAGETSSGTIEADVQRADGTTVRAESNVTALPESDLNGFRKVGVVRDVSDRVGRERALEEARQRYRTLVDHFPNGAVALVDEDCRYVAVGGTTVASVQNDELEGQRVADVLDPEIAEVLVPGYESALAGESTAFEHTFGTQTYQIRFVPVRDDDGEVFAAIGMSQDVTERKERERELRDAKAQLEAATEAGSVGTWEWHIPEDRVVAGASLARLFDVDREVASEGVSLDQFVSAIHDDDRDRVEAAIESALGTCDEYEAEYRVWNADGDLRWVVARGRVKCEDGTPVSFPGALIDITERKRAEQALERHREQLAALNGLHEVVRGITDAVVDQSTREEIESVVVDGLADTESFSFAWVGDVGRNSQTVEVRTEAGTGKYLDDITITVDPDDERSDGPTAQALLTGEMQVVQDVPGDDAHDPWRDQVERYDFRSSAAIPIAHEDTIYGVLNVYADRRYAFQAAERQVLDQLAEVVGHAIAAVERKRALMSDDVVELEFFVPDVSDVYGLDDAIEGRTVLEQAVPAGDDEFLLYGTADEAAWHCLEAVVEAVPYWESLSEIGHRAGTHKFEIRLGEPPILSVVASRGGYVAEAIIENDDLRMSIHLPPTVDSRSITEAVTETFASADLVAQRQFSRSAESADRLERLVHEELTERQRAAVEAAFHAGFFDWPRENDGEVVADSLNVTPPTFHQHLRKAERKVFETLLAAGEDGP